MEDRKPVTIPARWEWAAFFIIAAVSLLLRVNHLGADPPMDVSVSSDVYTDPAQYTSYARNMVLFGSFNPLHDFRLVFFLKSAMTVLSLAIFKLFGVGYSQANLVGLMMSFPTLILVYFIIRRIAGNAAALFYLILISVDYSQIFYGRLSFLENGMNFFGLLSFTVLLYSRRPWVGVLSGILLAIGVFFGKLIGLIYLFPFTAYAFGDYFLQAKGQRRPFGKKYLYFILGFSATAIFWYFFSYRPLAQSVSGYVEEQAFSLYGIPDALRSFPDFLYRYASLGVVSRFYERMIIPALLAWVMVVIFLYRVGRINNWKKGLGGITPGHIFLIALVLGGYGALMIWNYRPLRYQTILLYPTYALAGILLSRLLPGRSAGEKAESYRLFPVVFFVIVLIPLYQILQPFLDWNEFTFVTNREWLLLLPAGLVVTVAALLLKSYVLPSTLVISSRLRNAIVLIAVVASLIPGAVRYVGWNSRAVYATKANSADLARILSPEAVVSGPYAACLTLENRMFNLIHMFGVANVDTAFFRRYPITHIIVDKANDEYARQNYPDIMKQATLVTYYYISSRIIKLYRVSGLTGNLTANHYQLSNFELALDFYRGNVTDSGHYYMRRFQTKSPSNIAGNLFVAKFSEELQIFDDADKYFQRAIEAAPTDFYLRYKLGEFYIRMYKNTGEPEYQEKARVQLDLARRFNPISANLALAAEALLNGEEVADFE